MSGPKHLWSGNWAEESREPAESTVTRPSEPPTPDPARPLPLHRAPSRSWRFWAPVVAGAAVAGLALAIVLGGSPNPRPAAHHTSPRASLFPTVPTATVPSPTVPSPTLPSPTVPSPGGATGQATQSSTGLTGRTVSWLGMEISTVEGVGAVIQTVDLGSPADTAGLDPGDIIQSINGHSVNSADQIAGAVKGVKRGTGVPISVQRGSTAFGTVILFASPPKIGP